MIKISENNVLKLRERGVKVFDYNREKLKPNILHIGVGNFHRSHQAFIFDQVNKIEPNYGILGLNLIPDELLREGLSKQDNLYTLTTLGNEKVETYLIGSLLKYFEDLSGIDLSEIEIISLTLTQKGYYFDLIEKNLWSQIPENSVYHFFGLILDMLKKKPVVVISCDNLTLNSSTLKANLERFFTVTKPSNLHKLKDFFVFADSVVDRITPKASPELILNYINKREIDDKVPVFSEEHISWIIDSKAKYHLRALSSLPYVTFTEDVRFYENLKLLALNLTHFTIGILGVQANLDYVYQVIENHLFRYHLEKQVFYEVIPGCDLVNNSEAFMFAFTTFNRFLNKNLTDSVTRLARNSKEKVENLVKKAILNCAEKNLRFDHLRLTLILWCKSCLEKKLDVSYETIDELFLDLRDLIELAFYDYQHFKDCLELSFKVRLDRLIPEAQSLAASKHKN